MFDTSRERAVKPVIKNEPVAKSLPLAVGGALPGAQDTAPRGVVSPVKAGQAAGALGLGELAPAQAPLDEGKQREQVTQGMQALKDEKHLIKPDQKGPEVELMQRQLKQLGLHVDVTGVYDKATKGYIESLQTGGGLGPPDGVVGPKTIEKIQALDKSSDRPSPDKDASGKAIDHMPDDPKLAAVYLYNRMRVDNAKSDLTPTQEAAMKQFVSNWEENKARYEAVAAKAGVPAKLIASLHWRESTADFGTYLHQGDPLGKKAVNEPNDIPIFKEWEPAAEHALGQKSGIADAFKIDENTQDEAALMSYAERYNGLGYFNKGVPSPYTMSGTDQYKKGKYTRDRYYDPNVKDQQLGVLAMMRAIDGREAELAAQQAEKAQQDPSAQFAD